MNRFLIFAFVLLLLPVAVKAQFDTTNMKKDTTDLTIRQGDNAIITQPQPDLIQIDASQLPPEVVKALDKPRYNGWKNSVIYKSKSADEYMITVGDPEKSVTYRFNSKGDLVKKEKDNR